jgi:predicted phage-related endonuclease
VLIQVHHQMYVCGPEFRIAYVPVVLPVFNRFDFRLYSVGRSDELANEVADRCRAFWREHVEPRVPPTGSVPSLEVLKRVRRQPNKTVPVPDELVDGWIAQRAARLQAEKDEEAAKVELLTALGDAEAGEYSRGRVEYMELKRKGYTVEPSTYRALRTKTNKGA